MRNQKFNKNKIKVLITGVGGQLGQSIMKSLKLSRYKLRLIGTDCNPLSAGLYMVNKAYIVPKAEAGEYISSIINICKKESIDIIFIGTKQELIPLSKNKERIKSETKASVVVSDYSSIAIANDKWKTYLFFKKNKLPYPQSVIPDDKKGLKKLIRECGFPLIIKPRISSGAKSVFRVKDKKELDFFMKYVENPIIQEYLQPDDQEYTVGTYVSRKGKIAGIITIKRELECGVTTKAKVEDFPEIKKISKKIISKLKVKGPCNLQLRLTKRGPVVFEVNARFSSTAVIQAKFGFNCAVAAIEDFLFNKEKKLSYKKGIALRFIEEIYIKEKEYRKLKKNKYLTSPISER